MTQLSQFKRIHAATNFISNEIDKQANPIELKEIHTTTLYVIVYKHDKKRKK
jgi:hypothetical protein